MDRTDKVLALDWLRGLGVLIMLQGHLFNSFARADLHNHPVYVLSQFIGGMPAPLFLFLEGWIARTRDRKSTRLNSSHPCISYARFCLKKKIIALWGVGEACGSGAGAIRRRMWSWL